MFKRFAHPRLLTLLVGLLLASACTAQSGAPAPYTEGTEYVTLPAPHQRYSSEGKVEVVEVFSYGCIHCAQFAPTAEKLRQQLPAGVAFKLVPAPFSAEWLPYARAYYAAKQLGVVERTHLKLFDAKFAQHYPVNSLDELADFYAHEGVDRAAFMRLATSAEATAKLKEDLALIQRWQVDGTPTIVVNGKYRVITMHSFDEMVAVTQWLVKRELAGK
ncbi:MULTISPECIES: thiol:disulfide interchange protein DsbA/DsbL [Rhodanobacter]|uniref:Thiol:disulfide interchange protein n=1 Tax=Rhodanobacter denitrificans TaxID=666685 RepID=I4WCU1_9GAMM|nr:MULTISPECIES: thiol:disulfide interchange protein DsbA/DsbL [Rhodanobacter]AGG87431.1 protein-disulfide isomerase [Rhodanobacter denitrificans]EIL97282.1 protein-disulfide isomerase [Rhodanobacter denitrificans]KZC18789.1 disulfide bond formation protein DsbA [Rhodanobacter denitrificans]UJJ51349.1 thiol:disulfide interchange protein DsbA/DsbL [Rhodanobacter denitrificans]UJJ59865.1 thiol:disulfide interchange protein DsbA/DsbL [Rhodanobacter denitrificans]